ncbi:hypothetical protein NM208_g3469 [Fusarium decemcellulare]|uniref:Uncharacterized protein n=1 Tax=Fusarium decemcellulare TaxID=57161 RepID=A0ACC1SPE6_9HYPO|nr:hypothetical protein NM208_g3469 [Fusarium decemcellulare]
MSDLLRVNPVDAPNSHATINGPRALGVVTGDTAISAFTELVPSGEESKGVAVRSWGESLDLTRIEHALASESPPSQPVSPTSTPPFHRYPNPGYLGLSSHSTLFNHVLSSAEPAAVSCHDPVQERIPTAMADLLGDRVVVDRATHALRRLRRVDISKITPLVRFWLEKGVNLPLAEPFVAPCLEAVEQWRQVLGPGPDRSHTQSAETVLALLANTLKPIVMRRQMNPRDYLFQMTRRNLRWESLGILFTAAARAAYDIPLFAPLYTSNEQRRRLIKELTFIGDCCLETCLVLDCLNDLQLILQYENMIVHSQVDGDQSKSFPQGQKYSGNTKSPRGYHSWRRIGDVASSLFALGYHEKIQEDTSDIPLFIVELRKACFARIYAADKSLAVFLGRPPRIVKDYCHFKLPKNLPGIWDDDQILTSGTHPLSPVDGGASSQIMHQREHINYVADTRCSALFASFKEEVLQLFRQRNVLNQAESFCQLRERVAQQWHDLPGHFHLTSSLRDCNQGPFERDFLAGTRLDYLHILFLLGLAAQNTISEPDGSLLTVATKMLSIIVEVIILRDCLVNSGSCLVWKVAQYGLPAAGIVSLALLNPVNSSTISHIRPKMIQDLSVLVAEITTGAWIQAGEPNFALFSRATQTIQSLLDSLLSAKSQPLELTHGISHDAIEGWEPCVNSQYWDFEMDFWANLAEHPTLLN